MVKSDPYVNEDKTQFVHVELNMTDLLQVELRSGEKGYSGFTTFTNLEYSFVEGEPYAKPTQVPNEPYEPQDNGQIIAADSMDGEFGPINNQITGFGFKTENQVYANYPGFDIIADEGMQYPGLELTQKYLNMTRSGWLGRILDVDNGGVFDDYLVGSSIGKKGTELWTSVVFKTNTEGEAAVRFTLKGSNALNYTEIPLAIGNLNKASLRDGIRYWGARVHAEDIYLGDTPVVGGEATLIVVRFQFGAGENGDDIARIYINPDLSDNWYEQQTIGVSAPSLAFHGISFTSGATSGASTAVDEIRFGTTASSVVPSKNLTNKPINKVRIYPRKGHAADLIGGRIAGSNDSATNGFEDLFIIDSAEENQWNEYVFDNKKVYRFVKYIGPDGSHGTLSELEFFNDNNKISGTGFGTISPTGMDTDYSKAFDGDIETYYYAETDDLAYVGIDLGPLTKVLDPIFSLESKRYNSPQIVRLSSDTEGAVIKYTINGGMPGGNEGIVYNDEQAIELTQDGSYIIKAIAEKEGFEPSDVVVIAYGINADVPIIQSQSSMHIGNSLTDTVFMSPGMLATVAKSANYSHATYKFTVPGAPPAFLWEEDYLKNRTNNYDYCFMANKPDHVFLQQHPRSPFDGDKSEVYYSLKFYNKAYEYNQDVQPWVYPFFSTKELWQDTFFGTTPGVRHNEFVGGKMKSATNFAEYCENGMLFYEEMRDRIDAQFTGKTVLMVPIPLGFANMYKAITSGQIPGFNMFFATIFASSLEGGDPNPDTHLSSAGAYFVSLMVFSCMYQRSPVGAVTYKPDSLTEEQALIFQQIAWDTVKDYPYAMVNNLEQEIPKPTIVPTASPTPSATPIPTATPVVTPTLEPAPIGIASEGISTSFAGSYNTSVDINLGDSLYLKVVTEDYVDALDMYFVELGYGESYHRDDPRVTIDGNQWIIERKISYTTGKNTIKFRTKKDGLLSDYSNGVTTNITSYQPIDKVFVGISSNPGGLSASVLRGQNLYFKVTTSIPVNKLDMIFAELNYGETYYTDSAGVTMLSDTEWLIKRPIVYYKGSLTIGFKTVHAGTKSDLSETVSVTTTQ